MRNSISDYDKFMENYSKRVEAYTETFMTGIDQKAASSEYAN
jgi:hypothetical protein